ncbi:hypothetical protein ABKN59_003262 [Abortiporus biennis]
MTTSSLFSVDLASITQVQQLSYILQAYLPQSIVVLGSLHHGDIDATYLNKHRSLHIWTTFPLPCLDPESRPNLFSVIALSHFNDNQFRYFCSAEASPNALATADEESHVQNTITTFMHSLSARNSILDGVVIDSLFKNGPELPAETIVFGAVHDKWISSFYPFTVKSNICVKYIRTPNPTSTSDEKRWDALAEGTEWIINELREGDIDLIRSRATFPRSHDYILSRQPYSVCIRRREGDASPVAWQLVISDGALAMLHVETEFRRRGLARLCLAALEKKLGEKYRTNDSSKAELYPFKRWEHLDVVLGNEKSSGLVASTNGWKEGWRCHWIHLSSNSTPSNSI